MTKVYTVDLRPFIIFLNLLSLPALSLGGPALVLATIRLMSNRWSWSGWQRLVTAATGLVLLSIWALAPYWIAPTRLETVPQHAQLVDMSERELRAQLDSWNVLALQVATQRIVEEPEGYRTCVVGYSYFYIPLFRYELRWDKVGVLRGGSALPWPLACPTMESATK
jgi:hypothetical protein